MFSKLSAPLLAIALVAPAPGMADNGADILLQQAKALFKPIPTPGQRDH